MTARRLLPLHGVVSANDARIERLGYRLCVNARTGVVQGKRPYSWIKITVAVVFALIILAIAAALFGAGGDH